MPVSEITTFRVMIPNPGFKGFGLSRSFNSLDSTLTGWAHTLNPGDLDAIPVPASRAMICNRPAFPGFVWRQIRCQEPISAKLVEENRFRFLTLFDSLTPFRFPNRPRLGHRLYLERVRPGVFREAILGRRREEDEPGEIPEVALPIRDRNHDS